jgi:general L-amino acid transport system substrate-binding protein
MPENTPMCAFRLKMADTHASSHRTHASPQGTPASLSSKSSRRSPGLLAALRSFRIRLLQCILCLTIGMGSSLAFASGTVKSIHTRGQLRCGVSEGIPGFSARDAAGRWSGLDVDLCRAVAAAVLGDPARVKFVPLKASARFPALQAGQVDLLVRNTTWTMSREVLLAVEFPAVLFYDGQAFMVPAELSSTPAASLQGPICVEKGTTHERNLARFSAEHGTKVEVLVIDSAHGAAAALFAGKCRAYSSDASQLAALRLQAPGGAARYAILPERISKEPLGPVVPNSDPHWGSVVRWVLYTLVEAEERGITRATADRAVPLAIARGSTDARARADWDYSVRELGLRQDWAVQAIRAVGNYGEMFERNLGAGSPLRLERGLNRLWTQGGLMYAPPLN